MKSNISKHFAAKAKQGLRNCFADGMVQLPDSEFIRTGMQTFAAQENAKVAEAQKAGVQYAGPTTTDMKDKMIEINNQSANPSYQFGLESPNGRGAQHQFANKSMSDLQSGNQPYMPGSANDPHASASIGPKGPTRLPQASPSRTPLRQWQEPAFADGVVPETADQLMARMTAKYGAPSAGTRAPEPVQQAPQPVQQAPQPKPQTGGLFGQALRGLRGANDELRKAANYKDGMVHEGPGIVHGPGGPKEDKVDAKLSNGEAVLPAATVAALGGAEAVAGIIEATNGKAPAMGMRDGAHANMGGFVDDFGNLNEPNKFQGGSNRVTLHQQIAAAEPTAQAAEPTAQAAPTGATVRSGLTTQPVAAPTVPAQPLPRGEQFGRNAAKVYQDLGGIKGMAGKALNAVVPAAAAFDTMGADGIRVEGNREGDPTNESASGIERVGNAAKELGLRAGDWGTKGADMLMDLPLWAANKMGATSDGKPLEYGLINKNYRQGMRDANLTGVTIPQSAPEREMSDAKQLADAQAESKAMHKKYANKDGNMGAVVDQAAIDALKAANANKVKTADIAAASKAGSFPGQNRIPEAVTVQDQAASDMMGKEVDKLTGVSSTGDQGVRGMAQRMDSYANNESARQARNAQLQLRGDGARYEKGADGKITLTNSGDFDGSTKMPYTGADGKPTAVFAGSMENQRGIADAKGMRKQLANIEQMNLERNAKDDITDVGLRTYSRGVLKDQAAQNAKYNETMLSKQPSQLDLIKDDRDERKFQNDINNVAQMQRNNVRDHKAKQTEYMAKRSQTLLDNLFPTAGLKDDALKSAQQNRSDAEVALYAAAKSMPANDDEFDKAVPAMESQMRLTMAHKKAMQDQGIWQKLRNAGRDPITTLVSMQPKIVGDDFVYENGYKLPTKLVLGNDPALLAAHNVRVNAK